VGEVRLPRFALLPGLGVPVEVAMTEMGLLLPCGKGFCGLKTQVQRRRRCLDVRRSVGLDSTQMSICLREAVRDLKTRVQRRKRWLYVRRDVGLCVTAMSACV